MKPDKALIKELADSELFREYEQAYSTSTGMPVAFRSLETDEVLFQGNEMENSYCALMAARNHTCASCLQTQDALRRKASGKTATVQCAQGLFEAAVPVHLGEKVFGFLLTGQILTERPGDAQVEIAVAKAIEQGVQQSREELRTAYLKTLVINREKFESMLKLLESFAELLAVKSNELVIARANKEHPLVTKAKKMVVDRYAEDISLGDAAKAVNVSPFYLCKLFRRSGGMTFTEFVARTRVEKAKTLLLNPNHRVSEVVYEVGFQSLTHFNRVFKKLTGKSPTGYRRSKLA